MTTLLLKLLAMLLLICATSVQAAQPVLRGTVTRVIDGDTIQVQLTSGPIRVRLNGIDTPERGQPWGREATQALSALVMGKQVELEPFTQDRYERLVANVFVGSVNVNDRLVSDGHAWAYRKYLTPENIDLCGAEAAARGARLGLWGLKPQHRAAPWDWRKRPKEFVDYSRATEATCVAESPARTKGADRTFDRRTSALVSFQPPMIPAE
jgi:endonuclease YncB( thermonuclease family)